MACIENESYGCTEGELNLGLQDLRIREKNFYEPNKRIGMILLLRRTLVHFVLCASL